MEWVLRSPQIHSTFSNLGFLHADGYHVNESCNSALETILHNILTEDKYLRTYRRSISFGQNIKKDLVPLLIYAKEDKTIELLIRILVNLTIPVECLLSVDVISKCDFGRHTIFELSNLLITTKTAFTDHRATKVILEFIRKNLNFEQKTKLSTEQCTNISNSLLLLRNILHIPEDLNNRSRNNYNSQSHMVQNQILWNIFSQSIDKTLIKLITIPEATRWAVTMVQLIALLYKDQHVLTLHKLLNIWLEATFSESSEDNESNTSPPDRGSEDSSPILTSDPTSDSSDNGGKSSDEPHSMNNEWDSSSINNASENCNEPFQISREKETDCVNANVIANNVIVDDLKVENEKVNCFKDFNNIKSACHDTSTNLKKPVISENSDCGYGTQIENQGSISTSSNDEDLPAMKPVHQKPHNPKQRPNNKAWSAITPHERKRKKIVKRGKTNIINVQGLTHKTPTDDDIANVLKEFTVDFLLKGYNPLVQTLHNQILTNLELEIDTSHFFWLITYFLKFATQIELDLEYVCSVLCFDIVSYLTAEGANLCEQFELAVKHEGSDLKPCLRKLHLIVTAIREFVQAVEMYKKFPHLRKEDMDELIKLENKICETEDLRSLMILLLRHYNPNYHSKQYLQDLIVTNHNILTFLDDITKSPDYKGSCVIRDHLRQFTAPEIMYKYGILLEDYITNGEYVNDCIFTIMHHIGGELDSLISLFQPKILKIFTSIWKSDFDLCDDWSDLIEYVINTFIKKPNTLECVADLHLNDESFDDVKVEQKHFAPAIRPKPFNTEFDCKVKSIQSDFNNTLKEKWTEEELSSLSWNYMQCGSSIDVIGDIIKLFKEDDIIKSRDSVVEELLKQNLIDKDEYQKLMKGESDRNQTKQDSKETVHDEINKLCEELAQDGKSQFLVWVQKVLLDTCFAKLCIEKKFQDELPSDCKLLDFQLFKKKSIEFPSISPVSYHALLSNKAVQLVPWNCEQGSICNDSKFFELLQKLGFHMPLDTGKAFVRIPHTWTADFLYDIAGKIVPVDNSSLKFSVDEIQNSDSSKTKSSNLVTPADFMKHVSVTEASDNSYQIQKRKPLSALVNFTPKPGTLSGTNNEEISEQTTSWLEVVQRSQEYKLTLGHLVKSENEGEQKELSQPMIENVTAMEIDKEPIAGPSGVGSITLMTQTVLTPKQDVSINSNIDLPELYNSSLYDNATVSSNLMRMYVSDEDEQSDDGLFGMERNTKFLCPKSSAKRPRI